ncbi:hypothetical protein CRUP_025885 [Coryphaenoides rupestris]|nr:hypothetical protein CRUP_025885 [Coryphaenoides rupestris]
MEVVVVAEEVVVVAVMVAVEVVMAVAWWWRWSWLGEAVAVVVGAGPGGGGEGDSDGRGRTTSKVTPQPGMELRVDMRFRRFWAKPGRPGFTWTHRRFLSTSCISAGWLSCTATRSVRSKKSSSSSPVRAEASWDSTVHECPQLSRGGGAGGGAYAEQQRVYLTLRVAVRAEASWDSTVHECPQLSRGGGAGGGAYAEQQRVYLTLRVAVQLSHPAEMQLVLRKRLCVHVNPGRPGFAQNLLKRMSTRSSIPGCGVTFEVVSNIPGDAPGSEDRELLARQATSSQNAETPDNEAAIEKYLRSVLAVENILTLDRLRQSCCWEPRGAAGRISTQPTDTARISSAIRGMDLNPQLQAARHLAPPAGGDDDHHNNNIKQSLNPAERETSELTRQLVRVLAWMMLRSQRAGFRAGSACRWPYTSMATAPSLSNTTMQWGSLAPEDEVDVSTSGATMMGSAWSQKEYWQKTKLDRYWGSPVACRIFSCKRHNTWVKATPSSKPRDPDDLDLDVVEEAGQEDVGHADQTVVLLLVKERVGSPQVSRGDLQRDPVLRELVQLLADEDRLLNQQVTVISWINFSDSSSRSFNSGAFRDWRGRREERRRELADDAGVGVLVHHGVVHDALGTLCRLALRYASVNVTYQYMSAVPQCLDWPPDGTPDCRSISVCVRMMLKTAWDRLLSSFMLVAATLIGSTPDPDRNLADAHAAASSSSSSWKHSAIEHKAFKSTPAAVCQKKKKKKKKKKEKENEARGRLRR